MAPPSNCIIQGGGIDATVILNTCLTGGLDTTLQIFMTMTGTPQSNWAGTNTTYPINAPTLGGNTVTTTTAANAGNFAAGNTILVSGGLHGTSFWYPSWFTTVVSVNAGTGVITLAETLPFGGANITTVQKILTLPKNITIRDLTLSVNSNFSGVSGQICEIQGADTILLENVKFLNVNPTLPGAGVDLGPCRRSGFRNCHAGQGAGPIELFGASESFIEGCTLFQNSLLIDGGSMDCTLINNFIKDPQENAAAFHGIHNADYDLRIRIIGNSIVGLSGTFAGINCTDVPDANRDHVIFGNTIVGSGSGNTTGINCNNGTVTNNVLVNLLNGISINNSADAPFISGNYFDTCTNQIIVANGQRFDRNTQAPGLRTLATATATPTVSGNAVYQLFNSVAQNVTGFLGGQPGDIIHINMGDGNTTFVNAGGSLQMKGGVNYNPISGVTMTFMCLLTTIWCEVSRSA